MDTIDLATVENVRFVRTIGNIKKFTEMIYNDLLSSRRRPRNLSNSIIFVCGNGSVLLNNPELENFFEPLNKSLVKYNTYICFIRGNKDNIELFNSGGDVYSNIKVIKDYTVINIKNESILCVGGSLSIDRTWKMRIDSMLENNEIISNYDAKNYYNEIEKITYDEDVLNTIANSDINLTMLVTCSCPEFLISKNDITYYKLWFESDKELIDDFKNQTNIYKKIIDKLKKTLKVCIYSSSDTQSNKHNNINYISPLLYGITFIEDLIPIEEEKFDSRFINFSYSF